MNYVHVMCAVWKCPLVCLRTTNHLCSVIIIRWQRTQISLLGHFRTFCMSCSSCFCVKMFPIWWKDQKFDVTLFLYIFHGVWCYCFNSVVLLSGGNAQNFSLLGHFRTFCMSCSSCFCVKMFPTWWKDQKFDVTSSAFFMVFDIIVLILWCCCQVALDTNSSLYSLQNSFCHAHAAFLLKCS